MVDTTETGWKGGARQLGDRARELSPFHHLTEGVPPSIIFHGTADTTVPFENVERFCRRVKELRGQCEVVSFEGKKHAFFNYGKDKNVPYTRTVCEMDRFLVSLGYLTGEATIKPASAKK